MESELYILAKTLFIGGALVGCGYVLGRDKGVKLGSGKVIDMLCDNGYLRHRKNGEEVELIKINGEIE
jgi:hypothetical protein